jgi:MFS family permease
MGSLMVAPIISGPMSQKVGWRNFWWLNVAMLGLSIIQLVFMFPETRWDRASPASKFNNSPSSNSAEKVGEGKVEDSRATNDLNVEKIPTAASTHPENGLTHSETAARDPYLGKGKPGKRQWLLFQPNAHPFKSIFLDLWIPWKLFAFPIVEFASFVVSWSCSSFLTINLTQSQVLAAPPYSWSSTKVGFTNFAILVGAMIGLATAGPLSDWVAAKLTKKNGGIREPEMRLPAMIPYVIIMYLGNIIVSVGYQNKWPWEAIVIIGFTCAGIQVAALPSIASTYAVDSYKPVAGSLFVAITVNKNVWGYGFSKFITPWSEEAG